MDHTADGRDYIRYIRSKIIGFEPCFELQKKNQSTKNGDLSHDYCQVDSNPYFDIQLRMNFNFNISSISKE